MVVPTTFIEYGSLSCTGLQRTVTEYTDLSVEQASGSFLLHVQVLKSLFSHTHCEWNATVSCLYRVVLAMKQGQKVF